MIAACLPPRDVSRPKVPPPPNACDTHAHVFGPSKRFPYADDRSYTPPDAPLEKYLGMLDQIGFARGVLRLFELFRMWTPDQATQQRILVTNPAKLYGFPN
jgi:predicted TIM-barrel fold metal-dependent hydrolase